MIEGRTIAQNQIDDARNAEGKPPICWDALTPEILDIITMAYQLGYDTGLGDGIDSMTE